MLGVTIRVLRQRLKLTQKDLALRTGLSVLTISRYENGKREPRASDIKKLCEVLGVTEDELLNGPRKNEWKINVVWEVDDMQALDIKPNEFTVGFRGNDLILWGSIPGDKTLDEATGTVRNQLAAAMAGKEAYEAKKKALNG